MDSIQDFIKTVFENQYMRFAAILFIGVIVAFLAKLIFKRFLKPLTLKTKTKVDDLIVKSLNSIVFYVVFIFALRISIQHFEFNKIMIEKLIDSIMVIIVCKFLIKIINDFSDHWMEDWKYKTKSSVDERVIPLLQKILKTVVIILAAFFIFGIWKINVAPLLTTAGIAGLAFGLAVKDSLNNILGGIQLVMDKTFKVGDKVEIESGQTGNIMDIGLRSTKLKTFDNEVIYIPNGNLANSQIKNYTQPDLSLRVNVEFGVEYGSDLKKVQAVVLNTLNGIEGALKNPVPSVKFRNMGDSSLDFIARVWVEKYSLSYSMKLKMVDEIYHALTKEGIGIPFPTRTLYTKNMDE